MKRKSVYNLCCSANAFTKNKDQEYHPDKDKDIKKGPLTPEHKNQYGKNHGGEDRELPKRATSKKEEEEGKK